MKKLAVLLVVLAAIGVVGDLLARAYVEQAVATSTSQRIQGVGRVTTHVGSFPFLPPLLAAGTISHADIELDDVTGRGIDVAVLTVSVDGLQLDRGSLLHKEEVKVDGIDSATVTARIDGPALQAVADQFGAKVELVGDHVEAQVGGVDVRADVAASNGVLSITAAGLPPIDVPIPGSDLFPCAAALRVEDSHVELSCHADHLPQILVDAIGTASLRQR